MEAFVTTLLLTAIVQTGDRSQLLCAALAMRFERTGQVVAAVIAASAAGAALGALGGVVVGDWISRDALALFYALSLLFAGLGMLAWRRRVDLLLGWRIGPFLTALLGVMILQLGDKGQFIIAATAARTHDPLWPMLGGAIGTVIGLLPAIIWQHELAHWPLRALRIGAGGVITALGAFLALAAFGLV
ncbi:TMEM165/GDT1 family protein [Blastomonas sp.]|uniref:TMEM165/GDT1 family protein n=1 Tax=Blastomonas sp. TaxID=1909299 RepID=UPI0026249B7E|nr:TMEM165/GDT1 family protein [Blastomonas sp.]MDM7956849.1 TMEM165/GDT1 family protein [Blastomonas sp.]